MCAFTCLANRAIVIEVIRTINTDTLIVALIREILHQMWYSEINKIMAQTLLGQVMI